MITETLNLIHMGNELLEKACLGILELTYEETKKEKLIQIITRFFDGIKWNDIKNRHLFNIYKELITEDIELFENATKEGFEQAKEITIRDLQLLKKFEIIEFT